MRDILGTLPPYRGKRELVVERQLTNDIIREIGDMHRSQRVNYDKIAQQFWKGDVKRTAKYLFDFLRENVEYAIESGDIQTVKTPSAILHEARGDCKHYASFVVGVAEALQRAGYPISGAYMYVNGADDSNNFHHVFGVVRDTKTGDEYWVDPIDDNTFNRRKRYRRSKVVDMALFKISGDDDNRAQAEAFLRQRLVSIKAESGKKTKAEKKQARKANAQARKANKAARKAERQKIRAMPKPQRREYRKKKREDDRGVRKSASGVQKTAHIAMKIPNEISRNAFLGLVKINMFRMASKMAQKAQADKGWLEELKRAWFAAGGQWSKLRQAINQGVNVYNTKFKGQIPQISGPEGYVELPTQVYVYPWQEPLCNCETMPEAEKRAEITGRRIGEAASGAGGAIAIAALVAAAMPLIIKLLSLLKRSGVNTDEIEDADEESREEVLDEYNDAQDYPLDEDDPTAGTYGRSTAPQFGVKAYNDPNDGTATIEYTKTNMDDNGDVVYSDSGLDATLDTVKFWVQDNKTTLIWAGAGILALMYGPRLLDSVIPKRKRRR